MLTLTQHPGCGQAFIMRFFLFIPQIDGLIVLSIYKHWECEIVNNPNIGEKIKIIRKAKKLTQKQLAEKINKAESTVRMWELGKNKPLPEALKILSEVLEVNYSELMHAAGYLERKTKLEELTSDYVRIIQDIAELSVLISTNEEQIKKLNILSKEFKETDEKQFFLNRKSTNENEISMFTELLLDHLSSKERIELELENEKEHLSKEISSIIKTLNL